MTTTFLCERKIPRDFTRCDRPALLHVSNYLRPLLASQPVLRPSPREPVCLWLSCNGSKVPELAKKLPKSLPNPAENPAHNGVRQRRGSIMRRIWSASHTATIGSLQSQLDDLNKRLSELESEHPKRSTIDALKFNALSISRKIDGIRCAEATASLGELLRR